MDGVNSEGIYGSRPWLKMGEGPMMPVEAPGDCKGGSTAVAGPAVKRRAEPAPGDADFRFTVAQGALFAWG